MNTGKLPKIIRRPAKRVGRGVGSGKGGHTTGRGTKGQKARTKVPVGFEGTKVKKSFIKRLPYLRGKGKFKSWGQRYVAVDLDKLAEWPEKTEITNENLIKKGIISAGEKAKIVGGKKAEKLKAAWKVKVPVSKKAGERIAAAGGKIGEA